MERKCLLITCFEPFGGRTRNASQEAVAALPNAIGHYDLQRICLPVVFGEAGRLACEAIDGLSPDAVVCVGEAAGRKALSFETVAVNIRRARIPDNAGGYPQDEPVLAGEPERLYATLPVEAMVKAVQTAGVPAEASVSAGTFVCNDAMYLVLHHMAGTGTPAGFVHVPAEGILPCDRVAKGLLAAISKLP